jgi:hypothetical protein
MSEQLHIRYKDGTEDWLTISPIMRLSFTIQGTNSHFKFNEPYTFSVELYDQDDPDLEMYLESEETIIERHWLMCWKKTLFTKLTFSTKQSVQE